MSSDDETSNARPSTSDPKPNEEPKPSASSSSEVDPNAGALEVAEEKASVSDEYIRLRVITSDMTNEVHFRVKSATALGRLKRSYCSKLGFQVEELRFVFDGHRISDDDTPKSLGMINEDVIEIYQERTGGGM